MGAMGPRMHFAVSPDGLVGDDGYPIPLWDKLTGHIDHSVAEYMRDHGFDLRAYAEKSWPTIGNQLVEPPAKRRDEG